MKPYLRYHRNTTIENEVIALYVDHNCSAPKIAKRMHCSSLTILNILRANNVQIRRRGTYPTKDMNIKHIIIEYDSGDSLARIAARHGVTPGTILYHMRRHKHPTRSNRKLTMQDVQFVRESLRGMPDRQNTERLAFKYGVTQAAIRYHLKKMNSSGQSQ